MAVVVQSEDLIRLSKDIFIAVGTPDDIASAVAESLVRTNLLGHDSHGVIRVKQYAHMVQDGLIKASTRPHVQKQFGAVATISGEYGFGQIGARFGAELASELGATHGIGAVSVAEVTHIGRLGEYTQLIAEQGQIGIGFTSGSMYRGWVAPYGGRERVFGTNPMSFAVPTGERETLLLDFATAGVAHGKVLLAQAKDEPVPTGMLLDKDGNPTTDPAVIDDGGILLPMGLHKGFGLAIMMEVIPTLLAGHQPISSPDFHYGNPTLLMALSLEAFAGDEHFLHHIVELKERIKNVAPATGFEEVLLPGEPESRSYADLIQRGIPLPDSVWDDLKTLATELDVPLK